MYQMPQDKIIPHSNYIITVRIEFAQELHF